MTLPHGPGATRVRTGLALAALLVVVAVAYLPALRNGFVFDDIEYIRENPMIRRGVDARMVRDAFLTVYVANWHPLTWLSHAIDVDLFGFAPAGHHAVNLLLHLANILVLFLLLERMTGAFWRSLLVAALFGLHPLNVESVAWASQRKTLLSTLFALAALHAYVSYARKPGLARYVLVAGALLLGLLCKAMSVTLPLVLLLLDVWPLARTGRRWRWLVLEKVPLLLLATASSAVTLFAQQRLVGPLEKFPLWSRAANAVLSYGVYLGKTVVPTRFSVIYPHPGRDIPWGATVTAALLLAVSTWLAFRFRRSRPWLLFGWLWFLGTLVPVIGFVQVGLQSMADRYAYFPLIGVFVALVFAAGDARILRRRLAAVPAVAALVALAILTNLQARVWRDAQTLFRHALAMDDRNWLAHHCLAAALDRNLEKAEVIRHLTRAAELNPRFSESASALGVEYGRLGRREEALRWHQKALETGSDRPEILAQVAFGLSEIGMPREALGLLQRAVDLGPDRQEPFFTLGLVYAGLGRDADAVPCFERAIEISPFAAAEFSLGFSLERLGRTAAAAVHYARSIELDPMPLNPAQAGLRRLRAR